MFGQLRRWARIIKKDLLVLWFACRDPRTPAKFKLLTGALAAYALSPIDFIPDFIPFVGLLDDAVIVPLGVMLIMRLLPKEVKAASLAKAESRRAKGKSITGWIAVLLLVWAIVYLVYRYSV